jgi:hypothetical protein
MAKKPYGGFKKDQHFKDIVLRLSLKCWLFYYYPMRGGDAKKWGSKIEIETSKPLIILMDLRRLVR